CRSKGVSVVATKTQSYQGNANNTLPSDVDGIIRGRSLPKYALGKTKCMPWLTFNSEAVPGLSILRITSTTTPVAVTMTLAKTLWDFPVSRSLTLTPQSLPEESLIKSVTFI